MKSFPCICLLLSIGKGFGQSLRNGEMGGGVGRRRRASSRFSHTIRAFHLLAAWRGSPVTKPAAAFMIRHKKDTEKCFFVKHAAVKPVEKIMSPLRALPSA
ncbi:hypothetical protein [Dokdonella immobilis]|uniref:Uncharacterized protein n=1 Tax=Dokdonella immobilis TaxID=578942 RepID=A0A1I4Y159_9GAMM|nr:hypothetical protein [Dokdonella immobilis]SFN31775.1 hypothetical protein SAMN05216289_1149 [Dokdonella immobilis]